MPSYVIQQSQFHGAAAPVLNDAAIELIRRYALSKFIAAARCFISFQLKGFQGPPWRAQFADCSFIWSVRVMSGLPWLCRSEGSEKHLWFDADIHEWGPGQFHEKVRIYLPSVLVVLPRDKRPSADEVLRFIAPQLLERELEGRWPSLLSQAFLYPDRMRVTYRNENVIEAHHFHEPHLSNFNWTEALPAIEAMRDEILQGAQGSREAVCDALSLMSSADFALGDHKDVLLDAHRELWERLRMHDSKEQKRKSGGEETP